MPHFFLLVNLSQVKLFIYNFDLFVCLFLEVSIFVIGLGLRSVRFRVSAGESAFGLKQEIQNSFGIPVEKQTLWHKNALIGNRKLSAYDVCQYSNIEASKSEEDDAYEPSDMESKKDSVTIFVSGLGIQSVVFQVLLNESAMFLKTEISKTFGVPIEEQRLYHSNTLIGNGKLSEYDVHKNTCLDLNVCVVGGIPSADSFSTLNSEERWRYFNQYQRQYKVYMDSLSKDFIEIDQTAFEQRDLVNQLDTLVRVQAFIIECQEEVERRHEAAKRQERAENRRRNEGKSNLN